MQKQIVIRIANIVDKFILSISTIKQIITFDISQQFALIKFFAIEIISLKFNYEIVFSPTSLSNSTYLIFKINFQLIDDLLYYVKIFFFKFYVFDNYTHDLLQLIYDENSHANYYKIFVRLTSIYIRKLFKKLIKYICYCSFCQLNQTKRYQLYDELMFINTSHILYYIIVINFVLALFK